MKTGLRDKRLQTSLTALGAAIISLGLSAGSVLAVEVSEEDYKLLQDLKKKQAEKKLPPHERPSTVEPPKGGHKNLAASATNPIANLVQFQLQNAYSPSNHNSNGYSNVSTLQAVIPVKLPWEEVPLLITRSTLPYVTTPNFDGPEDRKRGVGDTNMVLLASPKLATKGVSGRIGHQYLHPDRRRQRLHGQWQMGGGSGRDLYQHADPEAAVGHLRLSALGFCER